MDSVEPTSESGGADSCPAVRVVSICPSSHATELDARPVLYLTYALTARARSAKYSAVSPKCSRRTRDCREAISEGEGGSATSFFGLNSAPPTSNSNASPASTRMYVRFAVSFIVVSRSESLQHPCRQTHHKSRPSPQGRRPLRFPDASKVNMGSLTSEWPTSGLNPASGRKQAEERRVRDLRAATCALQRVRRAIQAPVNRTGAVRMRRSTA
jgi:hypothetical protein